MVWLAAQLGHSLGCVGGGSGVGKFGKESQPVKLITRQIPNIVPIPSHLGEYCIVSMLSSSPI